MFELINEANAEKEIKDFLKELEPLIDEMCTHFKIDKKELKTMPVIHSFAIFCYSTGRTMGMARAKEIIEHIVNSGVIEEVSNEQDPLS
jgi:hypothetical protein